MKNLLNGIILIVLIFFYSENTFTQNITENTLSTMKIETSMESSSQILVKAAKPIRGDGINAWYDSLQKGTGSLEENKPVISKPIIFH